MRQHLGIAIRLTLICLLFFCGVYPLLVLGIARLAPGQGQGVTVSAGNRVVGYALEGQSFTNGRYFSGRPSAVGYNAAGSGGSNKGPTNPDYLKSVKSNIDSFRLDNPGVAELSIPSELVTASGSGLDPDISPAAALVQVPRIARLRSVLPEKLQAVVERNITRSLLGFLGPEKVNVLSLNLDLDHTFGK